ncbi:hypothetical protein GCM10022286_11780 [Gryllotalpicola daejeonensis]|uniref:CHAD domain-containing protein n=1 Tax=Gryllotalpicola daejeonensis TaxID=993087 RepID=A0ABP7ZHY6_9MICO
MNESEALDDWLRDTIATLVGLGTAVRRDDADSVHQARTTTRRLRAVLKLAPGDAAAELRHELKRYGQLLGTARDLEVRADLATHLLGELGDQSETDAAHERLIAGPRAAYRDAHAVVVDYLDGPGYRRLLELLDAVTDDADGLDVLAVEHEIRKHARSVRYLAEALGDDETAAEGARLQDAFGDRRDLELLARSLDGETDESLVRVREAARKRAEGA